MLQQDAIERLNLQRLLLEPEILQTVEADVHLVATLMSLRHLAPTQARETMRQVVRGVVDALLRRLSQPMQQAVRGSLNQRCAAIGPISRRLTGIALFVLPISNIISRTIKR